ncbi:MAG: methyltransferase domain-containing protein [bacterium]|nr:methyltransferase domain-containing protein [bacterium]
MNYDRIYEYRFKGVDKNKKLSTWKIIAEFMYGKLGNPASVIDPAAGDCEFINQVPAAERWAVDMGEHTQRAAQKDIKVVIGNNLKVNLPLNYFEGVYVSNFLEHLHTQEDVANFLERMFAILKPGGKIAIMGPNFKYCAANYFDFADHTVILTELGVAEHLYGAGFEVKEVHDRFLPLSFRGKIPVTDFLVKMYFQMPFAWRFMGKQFLLVAQKPLK